MHLDRRGGGAIRPGRQTTTEASSKQGSKQAGKQAQAGRQASLEAVPSSSQHSLPFEPSNYDFCPRQRPSNNSGKAMHENRSIGNTVYPRVASLVFRDVSSSIMTWRGPHLSKSTATSSCRRETGRTNADIADRQACRR